MHHERPEVARFVTSDQAREGWRVALRATLGTARIDVQVDIDFADDAIKLVQWRAFLRRTGLDDGLELGTVIRLLREFLWPVVTTAPDAEHSTTWPAGGPWQQG